MSSPRDQIPSLTPVRGIAALMIYLTHFDKFIAPLAPVGFLLTEKWYLMVDLFFILSAFVLAHCYGSWFDGFPDRERYMRFMRARFARVYPLHLLTTLIVIGLAAALFTKVPRSELPPAMQLVLDPWAIPANLLMVHAWGMHPLPTWNGVSWTISVEWFLYLVFPFLMAFMQVFGRAGRAAMLALAAVGLLAMMYVIQPAIQPGLDAIRQMPVDPHRPVQNIDVMTGWALFRGVCDFCIGLVAYHLYSTRWQHALLSKDGWLWVTCLVLLGLWSGDRLPDAVSVFVLGGVVLHLAYVRGFTHRLLNGRAMTWIGDISYSIYLVHNVLLLTLFAAGVFAGIERKPPIQSEPEPLAATQLLLHWLGAFAGMVPLLGIASLSYLWVEVPARRWLRSR